LKVHGEVEKMGRRKKRSDGKGGEGRKSWSDGKGREYGKSWKGWKGGEGGEKGRKMDELNKLTLQQLNDMVMNHYRVEVESGRGGEAYLKGVGLHDPAYCLHCGGTFRVREIIENERGDYCPNRDCDGGGWMVDIYLERWWI